MTHVQIEGMRARSIDKSLHSNPYEAGTKNHVDWEVGHRRMSIHIDSFLALAESHVRDIEEVRRLRASPMHTAYSTNVR